MKALDCCAGAGGLSLGLQRAGFDVLGVELVAEAVETHRRHVGPCDHASLWDYEPRERFDLVAGGIPCQSHSTAGKRGGTCDPRGQLYVPFLRIAREAGARAVLIENVRGMLTSPSATHGTALLEVVAAVRAASFEHVVHNVLDAADYGVPQRRHRLFLVGFRSADDARRFEWPRATHSRDGGGLFGLRRWVSVREALGLGGGSMVRDSGAPGGVRLLDQPAPSVKANSAHEGFDASVPNRRKWGQLQRELSALDQPAPCVTATEHKSANRFGSKGAATGPRRCGDQLNPLLAELATAGVLDRPATTVDTSRRLSAAGHHKTNKQGAVRLTIEQLAALQSFPPDFTFAGTKTQRHRQVGNAVPPPLAEAVGRAVLAALCENSKTCLPQRGGAQDEDGGRRTKSRKNPGTTRRRLAALLAEALPDLDVRPEDLQDAQGWHRSSGHWSNEAYRWEALARTRRTRIPVIFRSHDTMTACVRRGLVVVRGALTAGIEVHARPARS